MLLRSCGPVDSSGDRAPLRPLVAPVMVALAFGASARAGPRSGQTSSASPSASVIPCCCSRPSPFIPEASLSLLSGLSAVPPLGVSGTIPTLFRQEENLIMADQKPSTRAFETQLFVALEIAQVPSVKADTAVQEVRRMAGENISAELIAKFEVLSSKLDAQATEMRSTRWMMGAVFAVMANLTALGVFNAVFHLVVGHRPPSHRAAAGSTPSGGGLSCCSFYPAS